VNAPPLVAVIDDDPGMRLAVDALVRSLDYRTASFSSAEEFLDSDLLDKFSCIISDVKMGGMTGIELVAKLHGPTTVFGPPPAILVSAFTTEQMHEAAKAAGAIGLLKKPFDADLLIEHIEQAIGAVRG
jgi:FixJ family two-component response regulator